MSTRSTCSLFPVRLALAALYTISAYRYTLDRASKSKVVRIPFQAEERRSDSYFGIITKMLFDWSHPRSKLLNPEAILGRF